MFATTTRQRAAQQAVAISSEIGRSGMIAMKLDEGDAIVDVAICTEKDDVLLTTAGGHCIRFPVPEVRVFAGRNSDGVRGIALGQGRQGDLHGDPAPCRGDAGRARGLSEARQRRAARHRRRRRRGRPTARRGRAPSDGIELGEQRYVELAAAEQFVLTVSERGYGKRTSSYEYRITGRGGKGIVAMNVTAQDRPAGRPRSRSRRPTRSCWSPTRAS